jgi:DNA-binding transcriptional LysR family regulator
MSNIHVSGLDLNLLLLFHEAFSERSISRAAQKLGITQSAVSHSLARLRHHFQDDLLVRSGGHMVPTPRAEELATAVRELLDTLETRVLPLAQFDPSSTKKVFTTAMSDMGEMVILPPLMQALRHQAPGSVLHSLRLSTSEIIAALESARVDLAIGNVFEPQSNIYQQTLYQHDYAVIASTNHPQLKQGLTLQSYQTEGHIVADTGSDEHLRSTALLPLGLKRQVAATSGGLMTLPWLIEGTDLLATVPSHLARVACRKFNLQAFALPFQAPPYAIKTYWHPRSHSDAAHRWFRSLVYEVMHSYPDWKQ